MPFASKSFWSPEIDGVSGQTFHVPGNSFFTRPQARSVRTTGGEEVLQETSRFLHFLCMRLEVRAAQRPGLLWMGSGWDLDPASGGRSLPAGALQTGSLPNSPRLAKQHSICSEVLGLRPKGRAASRGVFPRSPWKEHNPSLSLEQSGSNPSLAAQTPTHGWGGLSGLGEALRLAL